MWPRLILATLLGAVVGSTLAQTYPSRPVRLLVPFAPGGGNDFLARLLGQKLGERLGQQVVVDNRPGAGGNLATDFVAKAAPDGYTLLLGFIGPLAISPNLEKVPYNPVKDFATRRAQVRTQRSAGLRRDRGGSCSDYEAQDSAGSRRLETLLRNRPVGFRHRTPTASLHTLSTSRAHTVPPQGPP